ncbi:MULTISPECIES: tRNA pseudouridine(55) synthase TruB [unclassified Fibrobacter]|uniref:tRNA pseudouridine(55) synthase TruB n=1 Tax=unclassified Fibrobacter TaxID=2634177 RepID=UPI0009120BAB|nr:MULTISPECIES: tRNA pseudouridine(55) synthase TruB [unclassified Fibrobacter]OWV05759.1 tRNA pseudouridine(55) synthase TruB [Fibrobacter sp. UWH3]SHK16698.1 tRNA pseudouridine55 synthase [Fibrobacter sp. UWH6]
MSNSGFVLLDKIAGETSFKALFPLKRVFSTKRVGHAGTLDLRASGLIIAATGRVTRLLPFVEAKDKCYSFRLHLGYQTDTLEWDGEVVMSDECRAVSSESNAESLKVKEISVADLEAVLPQFTGDIEQIPPKYCAVKINGVRASDLMERGRDIELKPRKINISSLKVLGAVANDATEGCSGKAFATFDLICECSKGTYIRALGRDIARALGTFGCVSHIRRHRIGEVTLDKAVRGDDLTREHLLPVDQVLDFPVVRLDDAQLAVIRQGNYLPWKTPIEGVDAEGNVFVANMQGEVLSFCHYEPGRIRPKIYLAEDE